MKKLSIEQKAKAYDELLLKLQKAKVDDNVCDEMYYRVIDDIVPELSESEDEKIRKALIRTFNELKTNQHINGVLVGDILTWLKKQKEQDPYNGVSFKCNGHTWGMCARDNGVDILLDRQLIKHLEKQGKQEEPQVYKTKDGEIIAYSETDGYKVEQKTQGKSALETINEEKVDNANKIETKFKDGNVLYSPTHHLIWIYKDNEHYYACVNMNYVTENVATDGLINIPSDVRPATKEQRDLLFQKMHEVGYEWDADKKELKKIEQKSVEWSEEDENLLELSFENLTELKGMYGEEYCKVGDCISWLKSLKQRYTWKPSDEQMKAFENFVRAIWESCYDSPYENKAKLLYSLLEQLKKLK